MRSASSAWGTAVIPVGVNARIGNVRDLGAVSSVSTGGVIVASCTRASMAASRADTPSVAGGANTGMSASRTDATGVRASRTDATGVSAGGAKTSSSVSAGRAKATGVASRADTGCADTSARTMSASGASGWAGRALAVDFWFQ